MATDTWLGVASGDDGYSSAWLADESIGEINTNANGLYVGNVGSGLLNAFWTRYKILTTIPKSSTIVSVIEKLSGAGEAGTGLSKIYGHDADNPSSPTSFAEYKAIPLTTASVDFDALSSAGEHTTSNLASIIQELVNDHELTVDAYILLIHKDDGSASGVRQIWYSWDYNSQSDQPYLELEWTLPVGGIVPQLIAMGLL